MPDVPPAIICEAPRALDGDTIACANLPARVRLVGIDAPELAGHCRQGRSCTPGDGAASKAALARLLANGPPLVIRTGFDRYGRILARVRIGRVDMSCQMIATGAAVPRYSPIDC
jgi:endonuclease YncB( thermonuclease family)